MSSTPRWPWGSLISSPISLGRFDVSLHKLGSEGVASSETEPMRVRERHRRRLRVMSSLEGPSIGEMVAASAASQRASSWWRGGALAGSHSSPRSVARR